MDNVFVKVASHFPHGYIKEIGIRYGVRERACKQCPGGILHSLEREKAFDQIAKQCGQ